jgi:hypothetical protein
MTHDETKTGNNEILGQAVGCMRLLARPSTHAQFSIQSNLVGDYSATVIPSDRKERSD